MESQQGQVNMMIMFEQMLQEKREMLEIATAVDGSYKETCSWMEKMLSLFIPPTM